MAPEVGNPSYELRVLRAAADGVEPALLLKAPGQTGEYLFNVPDGFSRLALEHKLTPSARLSCVLLTSLLPTSTGGLGGLILRLKHDGHGQFQIIGPQGSSNITHSLRHICRWQHPKVFVSECCDSGPLPVFEDEHIVIVPILAGDQSTGCPWCLYGSSEIPIPDQLKKSTQATSELLDNIPSRDCSGSSTSSDDTADTGGTRFIQSMLDSDKGDPFEKRLGMFKTISQDGEDLQLDPSRTSSSQVNNGDSVNSMPHVKNHSNGDIYDSERFQNGLPQRRKRDAAVSNWPLVDLDDNFFGHVKGELGKARKRNAVHHSGIDSRQSNSQFSLSSCKQLNCDMELCYSNSIHEMANVQSLLLGLTPTLSSQDDIKERVALNDRPGEGNPDSLAWDSSSKGTRSECSSELRQTPCPTSVGDYRSPQVLRRSHVASGLEEHPETAEDRNLKPAARGSRMVNEADVLGASDSTTDPLKGSFVHPVKPYDWLVSNLQHDGLPQLADDANPVYGVTTSTHVNVISRVGACNSDLKKPGVSVSNEGRPAAVLGYVSFLRKLNTAVLIVDCRDAKCLESLREHPTLRCIHSKGDETNKSGKIHTIAAAVHLTRHSLVQSSDYQAWMGSFTSPAHVVMNERSPEFGFQSSLATLQRLNSIHKDIFPLPPNMNSSPRCGEPTRKLTERDTTILDAELSMCLTFCKEGTTLSHASVNNSVQALNVKQMSSSAETSGQASELLFANGEAQRSHAKKITHLSSNVLAAAEIRRRLLDQKKAIPILPKGPGSQNKKNLSNDSLVAVDEIKNCSRDNAACESCLLPLIGSGNPDTSKLCRAQQDTCEDINKAFNVHSEGATHVALNAEQPMTSLPEVMNCDALTPQTKGLIPVEEYMKLHDPPSAFQLIFLGTGCAEPSKKRGSSGILLQVRGAQGAILLDAGEGAAGQLFRRFGEQGAKTIISSLQCLWLSHKHGDHALGILSILQIRSTKTAPLMIIGPHKVGHWLSEVQDAHSATGCRLPEFTFIHCDELSDTHRCTIKQQHAKQLLGVLNAVHLQSMRSVKVFHCFDAYGIILNGRAGWRVVYSGDTRPCKQLIEAGKGCTLLIHEATFEDSLAEQAICKRHSTVSEAVDVGCQMQASHIILTHFSQRYPEMVAINGDHNKNVSLAFDGMVVSSQSLDPLDTLLPLIKMACQKSVDIAPNTITVEKKSEGLPMQMLLRQGKLRPDAGQKICSYVNNSDAKESPAAKHKRWLLDSDDELDGQAMATSIRWSSDSEEDAEFLQERVLPTKNDPRDPISNIAPIQNICWGGIGPSFNYSEEIEGNSVVQGVHLENICQLKKASSEVRETPGPFGGKHLRWLDSDSEDG